MIPEMELREKARENGVPLSTVERDYAQNWLLKHLSVIEMALKGGTGIRKVYVENYRFSDDLDFTLLRKMDKKKIEEEILEGIKRVREESGINFEENLQLKENVNGYEGIVRFRITRRTGDPMRIKLDITKNEREKILLPLEEKEIIHPYSDECNAKVISYSLEEIVAEKIRSLFERTRPRDLYDVWKLWDRIDSEKVMKILPEKCKFKEVKIDKNALQERKDDFKNAWETSLRHQLKEVPDFTQVFGEILRIIESIIS